MKLIKNEEAITNKIEEIKFVDDEVQYEESIRPDYSGEIKNLTERTDNLELLMKRLDPVFELCKLTKENGMKSSLEFIIEQATTTSQNYVNEKLHRCTKLLEQIQSQMPNADEYQQMKNHVFLMEMKIGTLETTQSTIERRFQDFNLKVDKKVEVIAFNEEIKLINLNLRKIKNIEQQILRFALQQDLENLSSDLSKTNLSLDSLREKLSKEYYNRKILDEKLNKSNQNFDCIFLKLSTFEEFHAHNNQLFNELKTDIQKHENDMGKERIELQKLISKINGKAEKTELNEVDIRVRQCTTKEEFKKLNNEFSKFLKEYEVNDNKIKEKQDMNEKIILRFDEVITEKASKLSVDAVMKMTKDKLDMKINCSDYEQDKILSQIKIEECKTAVDAISKFINDLNLTVESEIRSAVKKSVQQAKSEIKFKYNECNILNEDDIKGLLSTKIEKQEVLSYLESKSNVKDTQETMKAIDIMHKQIKHICVILIEIMREKVYEFTKSNESENAKQK